MEWGRPEWRDDPAAALTEARRRVTEARETGAAEIQFSDLKALEEIPAGLNTLPTLRALWFGSSPEGRPLIGFLNRITDLTPLAAATQLETLDLQFTGVRNLDPLSGLNALTTLNLGNTQVSTLDPLRGLNALTTLDLGGTQVSTLDPLRGLNALTTLNLGNTQVSTLDPPRGLDALTTLDLGGTQVSTLDPLRGLNALTRLYLANTQVSDLKPLLDLPRFAAEEATALTYSETPAVDEDRRLDMLSRLPLDRCAKETIQYLKGTHPDFRDPPPNPPPDAENAIGLPPGLMAATTVAGAEVDARLSVADAPLPTRIPPPNIEVLLRQQMTIIRQVRVEDRRVQLTVPLIDYLELYQEELQAFLDTGEPFYEVLEVAILALQENCTPDFLREVEEASRGLKKVLTALLQGHATMLGSYRPEADAARDKIDLNPGALQSALELSREFSDQLRTPTLRASIDDRVLFWESANRKALEASQSDPLVNRAIGKRVLVNIAGFLSSASALATLHGWVGGSWETFWAWGKWFVTWLLDRMKD